MSYPIPVFLRRSFLPAAAAVMLLGAGCGHSPPAVEPPPPAPVEVVRPWKTSLDGWTALPGTTQALPNHRAQITASVEGAVELVPATEGQWVKPGQVIVQLNSLIAQENLAKAQALPRELTAQRKQAENAVQVARDSLKRLQDLRNSSSATGTTLASPAEIEQAQAALTTAQAQLQVLEARQASSSAAVEALRQQLSLYTLRTPIAGWLSTVHVTPGQTIPVGTTVAEVIDLKQIDVVCFVPPSRIGRIALGQPAHLVRSGTESSMASALEGSVVYRAQQAQAETGSFAVKVRFPNEKLGLPANTIVDLLVRTTPPQERLVIPEAALMEDQEPPLVAVVSSSRNENGQEIGKVQLLQAVTGVRNRQRRLVEVLGLRDPSGKEPVPAVQDGWYVIAGGNGLENGDEVRVTVKQPDARK